MREVQVVGWSLSTHGVVVRAVWLSWMVGWDGAWRVPRRYRLYLPSFLPSFILLAHRFSRLPHGYCLSSHRLGDNTILPTVKPHVPQPLSIWPTIKSHLALWAILTIALKHAISFSMPWTWIIFNVGSFRVHFVINDDESSKNRAKIRTEEIIQKELMK